MSATPLTLSPAEARRFAIAAQRLGSRHADVGAALAYHGFVQIDPINICGRMHDLILRNRVTGYREGDLMRHLHGDTTRKPPEQRTGFEHHVPDTGILVALPWEAWPHLQASMQARTRRTSAWSGRLTARERELAGPLLEAIAERGPLSSEDFEDQRRQHRSVWGAASLVKATLQKLFFHGRVLIAERVNNRRRYDLPERVAPAAVLAQKEAPAEDTARWLAQLKLRQRRLVRLKRDELPRVEDLVQPLAVEGCPMLYCLRDDLPLLEAVRSGSASKAAAPMPLHLLAPLDPLIYDRQLTAKLWGFDYTWEAYTPPQKRVRGYYALPVLAGGELVGHVDPKADRAARRLQVVSRRVRRGHAVAPGLKEFARWLGLR